MGLELQVLRSFQDCRGKETPLVAALSPVLKPSSHQDLSPILSEPSRPLVKQRTEAKRSVTVFMFGEGGYLFLCQTNTVSLPPSPVEFYQNDRSHV